MFVIHVAVLPSNCLAIRWNFTKFGTNIIPLHSASPLYLSIYTVSNSKTAAVRNSKVADIFVKCKATKCQQRKFHI